mgnify:CR=1 FL=1
MNYIDKKKTVELYMTEISEPNWTIVDGPGWYFISAGRSDTFFNIMNERKENPEAMLDIYKVAYFFSNNWPENDIFKNINWETIYTTDALMNPYLGYWVLITKYTVPT